MLKKVAAKSVRDWHCSYRASAWAGGERIPSVLCVMVSCQRLGTPLQGGYLGFV